MKQQKNSQDSYILEWLSPKVLQIKRLTLRPVPASWSHYKAAWNSQTLDDKRTAAGASHSLLLLPAQGYVLSSFSIGGTHWDHAVAYGEALGQYRTASVNVNWATSSHKKNLVFYNCVLHVVKVLWLNKLFSMVLYKKLRNSKLWEEVPKATSSDLFVPVIFLQVFRFPIYHPTIKIQTITSKDESMKEVKRLA